MKKVAIISLNDLRHITMIKVYIEYLKKNNIPFDIICTERYGEKIFHYEGGNVLSYQVPKMSENKFKKLIMYFKYRNYVKLLLQKNKYKYIVVWGEHTAVLLEDILKKNKPYCVNIRDIKFPRIPFYWKRLDKAVKNSDFSTWCAQTGKELLPKYNYQIILNQNNYLADKATVNKKLCDKGKKIRIGTIGYIRHIEAAQKIMVALKNDERYVVQFFGTGADKLKEYAEKIGMKNYEISGTFNQENTANFLDKIDVINAYCGDGKYDKTITIGAPIRYGYSTKLYKPAIVSPNTFISKRTKELNIAYTIDNLDTFPNEFYKWYHSLNFINFKEACDVYNEEYLNSINELYKVCELKLKPFLI